NNVGNRFSSAGVPLWTNENQLQDDLGFTGTLSGTDFGPSAARLSQLNVVNSTHYASGGLSGTLAFLTAANTQGWGIVGPYADVIAEEAGTPAHKSMYAY